MSLNNKATILTPDPTLPAGVQMQAAERFNSILPWYPYLSGGISTAMTQLEELMDQVVQDIANTRK